MGKVWSEFRGALIAALATAIVAAVLAWVPGAASAVWGFVAWTAKGTWNWTFSTTPVYGWLLVVVLVFAVIGAWNVVAGLRAAHPRPE